MDLPVPPEPVNVRDPIVSVRQVLGEEVSGMDLDSLAVWSFNKLPAYLWRRWGSKLKLEGFTWQKFLKCLKYRTEDMVLWALKGSLSWEELVKRLKVQNTYSIRNTFFTANITYPQDVRRNRGLRTQKKYKLEW